MSSSRERHTSERRYFTNYAAELRERFTRGLLQELLPYPQFVVWRPQIIDGQWKKPPVDPKTGRYAAVSDSTTWASAEQALTALQSGLYTGLGFVLTDQDPFCAIDLDQCVNPNRFIHRWAQDLVQELASYTEYSPRDGLHLFTKAKLPGPGRKAGLVELYDTNHYLTLTLNHVPQTPSTIETAQIEVGLLYARLQTARFEARCPESTGGALRQGAETAVEVSLRSVQK